jgi:hypothetical protein
LLACSGELLLTYAGYGDGEISEGEQVAIVTELARQWRKDENGRRKSEHHPIERERKHVWKGILPAY